MHGNAYSRTVDTRIVTIGQTPDIFDPQYGKDVVETGSELHIRDFLIHHTGCGRESPQVIGIGMQCRIVLIGQMSEHTFERDDFTQFHILDQRNAVEQYTVGKIGQVP